MNAIELLLPSHKPSGVWACGKCGTVHAHQDSKKAAEMCCEAWVCEKCEKPVDHYWKKTCSECVYAEQEKRLHNLWSNASKVPFTAWDGKCLVYDEKDGEFLEAHQVEDLIEEGKITPETTCMYLTRPLAFYLDAKEMIHGRIEELEMDEEAFDRFSEKALSELQAYLDAWCAENLVRSWFKDSNKALSFEGLQSPEGE